LAVGDAPGHLLQLDPMGEVGDFVPQLDVVATQARVSGLDVLEAADEVADLRDQGVNFFPEFRVTNCDGFFDALEVDTPARQLSRRNAGAAVFDNGHGIPPAARAAA
jgi:hypothetical protein